ncbi:MAG: hypothetical protein LBC19_00340 [Tannerella sp.]|jgi:hypothetical protein|nr:hypothetical protein [Tannerella sp.]
MRLLENPPLDNRIEPPEGGYKTIEKADDPEFKKALSFVCSLIVDPSDVTVIGRWKFEVFGKLLELSNNKADAIYYPLILTYKGQKYLLCSAESYLIEAKFNKLKLMAESHHRLKAWAKSYRNRY